MFKFTFNIGSHLFNPFTAQHQATESVERVEREQRRNSSLRSGATGIATAGTESPNVNGMRRLPAPPQRVFADEADADAQSGSTPAPTPLSRKRGWAPSSSSPSAPLSSAASTNGWLDTPSRYVEAANSQVREGGSYDYQGWWLFVPLFPTGVVFVYLWLFYQPDGLLPLLSTSYKATSVLVSVSVQ